MNIVESTQAHTDESSTMGAGLEVESASVPENTPSSRPSQEDSPVEEPSSVVASVGSRHSVLGQHAHLRVESAEVQALHPSRPSASTSTPKLPNPLPAPTHSSESEFIDVRPLQEILQLVSSQESKRIQGRLERLDGSWAPVVGIYEPEQTFNFISDALVSELDLLSKVEQYTGEEGGVRWVESPHGRRIRPTGTVQIRWERPQLRPSMLTFWVFPYHEKRSLVFGEPWAHRSRYMRRED